MDEEASGPSRGPRRYQLQEQRPMLFNPLCLSLHQCENLMLVSTESPVIGSLGLIGAPASTKLGWVFSFLLPPVMNNSSAIT